MKPVRLSFMAAAATMALAAMGTSAPAMASSVVASPGSECKTFGAGNTNSLAAITPTQSGMRNYDLSISRTVICPVNRMGDSDGVSVYVDGTTSNGAGVSCVVYSYNYDGTLRASKGFVEHGATFDHPVVFTAAEAPIYSYLNAVCSLPPKGYGSIIGVVTLD